MSGRHACRGAARSALLALLALACLLASASAASPSSSDSSPSSSDSSLSAAALNFTCGPSDDAVTCAALGVLYASTGGANWVNNYGWASAAAGTPTTYCSFYGVTCGVAISSYVFEGVKSLSLSNNNLTGTLPDACAALVPYLNAIDVTHNNLSGVPTLFLELLQVRVSIYWWLSGGMLLWPQNPPAVLEGFSKNVTSWADILSVLEANYLPYLWVTTFVLTNHFSFDISCSANEAIFPILGRVAPVVLAGNTAACLGNSGVYRPPWWGRSTASTSTTSTSSESSANAPQSSPESSTDSSAASPSPVFTQCTIDLGGLQSCSFAVVEGTSAQNATLVLRNLAMIGGNYINDVHSAITGFSSSIIIIEESLMAYNTGGVVHSYGAAVTARNTTFLANAKSVSQGSAILLLRQDSTYPVPLVTLDSCAVVNSSAHAPDAVMLVDSNLVATNTNFSGNAGGAVSACIESSVFVTFTGCSFTNNSNALLSNARQGASSAVTFVDCMIGGSASPSEAAIMVQAQASGSKKNVLRIINSSLYNNTAMQFAGGAVAIQNYYASITGSQLVNNGALVGGAIYLTGGSLTISDSLLGSNFASGSSPQGGCVALDDQQGALESTALVLLNTTFCNCSTQMVRPDLRGPGAYFLVQFGGGGGGGLSMVVQRNATVTVRLGGGTSFVGNSATDGAAMFLYGPVALYASNTSFVGNVAQASGGALYMQPAALGTAPQLPASVMATASTFGHNSAPSGGVALLYSGSRWNATSCAFNANSAQTGAVLSWRVADQPGAPPAVTLSSITATGNVALSGALTYHDSPAPLPPPTCDSCTFVGNVQTNGNATPSALALSATTLSAPSGLLLPTLSMTVSDSNGDPVIEWPGLVIALSSGNFTGVSGTLLAGYSAGAARFTSLSVSDVAGAQHMITYTVSAPSMPLLDALTGNVTALVQPCAPLQTFDAATLRCTSVAGTFTAIINASTLQCQTCAPGYFSAAGAASCTACAPGSYSASGFTQCTPCAAGTYLDIISQQCQSCTPGFASASGATSCTPCAPGSYSAAGFTQCTPCAAGTYLDIISQQCQSCTPGFFSASGATSCTPCAPGSYSASGFTQCTPCAAGTYLDITSQQCLSCPSGLFSAASATACTPCAPGSYSDLNFTTCTQCKPGTYLDITSQQCQSCTPGSFSAAGATACTPCAIGSYSDLNFTTCTACQPGFFLNASSLRCQSCTPGSFSGAAATACTPCAPGSVSSSGFTQCTPCAAGTYLDVVSQQCQSCTPGSFSAAGATACTACAPGSYSTAGLTQCTPCGAGTFLNASAQQCQSCTPGFFSAAGATACTSCAPGSYSSAGFTQCTPCGAGTFYNASSQKCDSCPAGTYNPTPGAVACVANPTGFASVSATNFSTNVSLDVPPDAFGAAQAVAMTASLAATLGVDASSISHSVVAAAGVSRRRLAQQQGLTLAVVVVTQGSAAASRVRAAVASPTAFSTSLLTQLHASGDPVLSAASSVVPTAPAANSRTPPPSLPVGRAHTWMHRCANACRAAQSSCRWRPAPRRASRAIPKRRGSTPLSARCALTTRRHRPTSLAGAPACLDTTMRCSAEACWHRSATSARLAVCAMVALWVPTTATGARPSCLIGSCRAAKASAWPRT